MVYCMSTSDGVIIEYNARVTMDGDRDGEGDGGAVERCHHHAIVLIYLLFKIIVIMHIHE